MHIGISCLVIHDAMLEQSKCVKEWQQLVYDQD